MGMWTVAKVKSIKVMGVVVIEGVRKVVVGEVAVRRVVLVVVEAEIISCSQKGEYQLGKA